MLFLGFWLSGVRGSRPGLPGASLPERAHPLPRWRFGLVASPGGPADRHAAILTATPSPLTLAMVPEPAPVPNVTVNWAGLPRVVERTAVTR